MSVCLPVCHCVLHQIRLQYIVQAIEHDNPQLRTGIKTAFKLCCLSIILILFSVLTRCEGA